jgi:prepilin-type N-terminal cleavage/methylation domain-containing protein
MKPLNKDSRGFTLIEVIVSLVLVGLLAAIAGMGIVQATKAFIFTKEAITLSQKGDLAMSRLRRSVQNMTAIVGIPTSTSLAVQRLNKSVPITESYSFTAGTPGTLDLQVDAGNKQTLADSVQNVVLTYTHTNGSPWTPPMGIDKLATINVSASLTGPGGAVVNYVDKIMPRNTYSPKPNAAFNAVAAGAGSYNCFVATVAYGSGDDPAVRVLRQFRDHVLTKFSMGRAFISWYYKVGPNLANSFKSSDFLRAVVRVILLPFVGTAFLILYFPAGIPLLILMAWLLARLVFKSDFMQNFFRQRLHWQNASRHKGSMLIGLIVIMVIVASLGGAMVSMFSSANVASIPAYFSQNAYYLAESGRNYAAKMFLANRTPDITSDQNFINAIYDANNVSRIFPVGTNGDNFRVKVKAFYFGCTNAGSSTKLSVSKWGDFPDNWLPGNLTGKQGWLQIPTGTSSTGTPTTEFRKFKSVTNTGTLDFTLDSAIDPVAGRVMPVVHLNGAQTIKAKNVGEATEGGPIDIGNIDTGGGFMLPLANGIMSFTDTAGNNWKILYERLVVDSVTHNVTLQGIRNYPYKPIPTAGIPLADATPLVLERYAQFVSKGTVGNGLMAIAQTITYNQPLDIARLYVGVDGTLSPLRAELGSFAPQPDGSIKITGTSQSYSLIGGTSNTYMQESLQVMSGLSGILKEIWEQSDHVLSYEVQAKIKFTETEDDLSSSPVNFPGNYMPGIAFRVKCTKSGARDCSYYGVSFVRGIQGTVQTSSGCAPRAYVEEDDISDNLFEEFSSNTGSHPQHDDFNQCTNNTFATTVWDSQNQTQSSTWNQTVILGDTDTTHAGGGAALDGIPYIMLWQKDWSVNTRTCGRSFSPWDWLTFMPLVDAKVSKVYYYPADAGTGRPAGWYEAKITDGTAPFTYTTGRLGPYTVWKLRDKYGVLKTYNIDNKDGSYPAAAGTPATPTLGLPGDDITHNMKAVIRDTSFLPVNKWDKDTNAVVGFILPNVNVDSPLVFILPNGTVRVTTYPELKSYMNYRIYPKPWVTIAAKILEFQGDFDCKATASNPHLERINAIMAYVSSEDGVAGNIGSSPKDAARTAYARNPSYPDVTAYTVRWPDTDDYFTTAVWDKGGYTSATRQVTAANCSGGTVNVKLAGKGADVDGDNVIAYSGFLTTDYTSDTNNYFYNYDIPEFGYHTAGISAASGCSGVHCETAYFTDGYYRIFKGGYAGLLPNIQEQ